jgi:acyl-CoA synthetase (AMP-forming)/AMP-acid ligase II
MKSPLRNLGDLLHAYKDVHSDIVEIDHENFNQRCFTTHQLETTAQSTAWYLQTKGYGPEDRIAIVADNCLESIVCYLAVLKLGGIVVMISYKATLTQISNMLQDSKVKLVLTDLVIDSDIPVINFSQISAHWVDTPDFDSYEPDEKDTAVILHTSGSTGNPHRVLITHQARLNMLANTYSPGHRGNAKLLFANPLYHSMGMNSLDLSLYNKRNCCFLKKFDPIVYLKTIDQLRPSGLVGVPSMFSLLVTHKDLIRTLDLSSVQNISLSGGATTPSLYAQLKQTFEHANIRIAYGSTELGPGVFGSHKILPTPPMSVGCEQQGILYRLADKILQVKSPLMMKGYDNQTDSFTHDGYYITNDQFEVDQDGFYYFLGRSDDMFKSGGNKIFPSEIERVVEQHPAIDKCVAVPISDPVKEFKPYGFVTLKPGAATTPEEIMVFLQDKLARYQMPRQIWILDNMPLSAVNKIDKQRLIILAGQHLNT